MRVPWYRSLYLQVLLAIAIGVLIGHFWPETGAALKPLGDAFIKLIKMLIGPVIFCTVVLGIAGMESMSKVGKVGGLALLYFEAMSTVALLVGLLVVNTVRPGDGLHASIAALDTQTIAQYAAPGKLGTVSDFVLHLIPDTFVGAFAEGEILQVLLISILFGFALHRMGRDSAMFRGVESFSKVLFGIVSMVMRVAPLGALGAMAFTVGKYGIASLWSLGKLMVCFYATCLLFVFIVLGCVARVHGFSIVRVVAYLRDELFIVLGTSSSESVLPRLMLRLEALGVRKTVVGLVVPTGYSFNLDGTSIYLTMAAIFVAQATDTPLSLGQQLLLLTVLLLTSKGAAGVTGSGFIVLAATLGAVGHVPVAGLALILGIDRFMSEARALTNLVGNAVATIVVGRWCEEVDVKRLERALAAGPDQDQA